MPKYFMGIDIGGTMTKTAIFDTKGAEIAVAAENTPVITTRENYQERDMLLLWDAVKRTIKAALTKSGIHSRDIAGIGCTGHGKGLYLWGKDGRPAYNAIASTDHRAADIVKQWDENGISEKAKKITLQNVIDCQPAALLAWMKETHPEVLQNTQWIFEAKDYIRFMLTGEAYAEVTDYSGTSLMNLHTQSFDKELMKLFGIGVLYDCLPLLKYSYEHCGCITEEVANQTGLYAGIPVCGGMFDIDACAIAMDVSTPEKLCVITGTWSINEYISEAPIDPAGTTQNSLFCIPGFYLIEESSPTSAGNLEWVIEMFLTAERAEAESKGLPIYQYIDEAVISTSPHDSGLIFFPFLYGSNANYTSSAFFGLNSSHTKAHILRAVFEGVVFSHMTHIEKLLELRENPSAIRIAGGAVNSSVWTQMFADVIGLPVEVVGVKELGAMGAAMAAAISAGEYRDYRYAAGTMGGYVKTIFPHDELNQIYSGKYMKYKNMLEVLR